MSSTHYPLRLPHLSEDLVKQLDEAVPPATIEAPPLSDARLHELLFAAGRRSLVDELVRLKARKDQDHGI